MLQIQLPTKGRLWQTARLSAALASIVGFITIVFGLFAFNDTLIFARTIHFNKTIWSGFVGADKSQFLVNGSQRIIDPGERILFVACGSDGIEIEGLVSTASASINVEKCSSFSSPSLLRPGDVMKIRSDQQVDVYSAHLRVMDGSWVIGLLRLMYIAPALVIFIIIGIFPVTLWESGFLAQLRISDAIGIAGVIGGVVVGMADIPSESFLGFLLPFGIVFFICGYLAVGITCLGAWVYELCFGAAEPGDAIVVRWKTGIVWFFIGLLAAICIPGIWQLAIAAFAFATTLMLPHWVGVFFSLAFRPSVFPIDII